jgi:hypothetical protein
LFSTSSFFLCIELSRSFQHPEEYTPSVDSAMESWDSSNADHRFSDNSEITKEIIVNDHQQHSNYQDTSLLHIPRSNFIFNQINYSSYLFFFSSKVISL